MLVLLASLSSRLFELHQAHLASFLLELVNALFQLLLLFRCDVWLTIVVARTVLSKRVYELLAFGDLGHATSGGWDWPAWTLLVLNSDLVDELAHIL